MMDDPKLFSTGLPLIKEEGLVVTFGGETPDNYSWGETEYGPARAIAGTYFEIDKRFWEMLGKPQEIIVGFANEDGWEKWVGIRPNRKNDPMWREAF